MSVEQAYKVVRQIQQFMKCSKNVLMLSVAGLGRSALLVALALLTFGAQKCSAEEAVAQVRQFRSARAIECKRQMDFIQQYSEQLSNLRLGNNPPSVSP